MSKKSITFTATVDRGDAIGYLEELVNGLKSGTFYIQGNEEYISVSPPDTIQIEVKAKSKKDSQKVSVELAWTVAEHDDDERENEEDDD